MRFWRSIVLLALALGLLALPAAAQEKAAAAKPAAAPKGSTPQRSAWMFGFNYGNGGTRFVSMGQSMVGELRSDTPAEYPQLITAVPDWIGTDIESSPVSQFRIGYAISPTLAIGFERVGWQKDFGDYSWNFNTSTLSATCYPYAGHLFFRAGAGISAMAEKIPQTAPLFIQFADRGVSLEGAIGWERDLYKRVSIAPEISLRSMNYGRQVRAQIGAASLGFNWWF